MNTKKKKRVWDPKTLNKKTFKIKTQNSNILI